MMSFALFSKHATEAKGQQDAAPMIPMPQVQFQQDAGFTP